MPAANFQFDIQPIGKLLKGERLVVPPNADHIASGAAAIDFEPLNADITAAAPIPPPSSADAPPIAGHGSEMCSSILPAAPDRPAMGCGLEKGHKLPHSGRGAGLRGWLSGGYTWWS